jgi:spore coat protein U-like protein
VIRRLALALLALVLAGGGVGARACAVAVQDLAFGVYDPLATFANESTGRIDIECDAMSEASYRILISAGSGSFADRTLRSADGELHYNLYTDMLRTRIWGDGNGFTDVVAGSAARASYPVYGRLPARQNVSVGSYRDLLYITVEF